MQLNAEYIEHKHVALCDFDGMPNQNFPRMMRVRAVILDIDPFAPSRITVLSSRKGPEKKEEIAVSPTGIAITWIWNWSPNGKSMELDAVDSAIFISNTFKGTGKSHFWALRLFSLLKTELQFFAEPASYPLNRKIYLRPGEDDDVVIANERNAFAFMYTPFSLFDRQRHRISFSFKEYGVFPFAILTLIVSLALMFLGSLYRYARSLPVTYRNFGREFEQFRRYFSARAQYDGGLKDAYFKCMEGAFIQRRALGHPCLEIGVSDGNMSQLCLTERIDVSIDPIGFLLAAARQKGVCEDYLRADARAMPFADASFAEVICIDVLHHVPNGERAIDEIHRILKKDGVFTLTTVSDYSVLRTIKGLWAFLRSDRYGMREVAKTIPLYNCRSMIEWQDLLVAKGFEISETSHFCHIGHWFMFLAAYYLMHQFKTPVMAIFNKIAARRLTNMAWNKALSFISFSYFLNERRIPKISRGHNLYLKCVKL
jgi:SAM-dependent methyltransferase